MSNLPSYPAAIIEMKGQTANDYSPALIKGFYQIMRYNIRIGTAIIDGNKAQKKSLGTEWSQSLYNRPIPFCPELRRIIPIPCLCHLINNVYKSAINCDCDLKSFANRTDEVSKLLREKSQEIGAKCPKHCNMRWLIDYFILDFIRTHSKAQEYFSIDSEFFAVYQILRQLITLILIFESTHTPLSDAFILIERTLAILRRMADKNIKYAQLVYSKLKLYTLDSEDGGIWSLAYMLTPKGRNDFYERLSKNKSKVDVQEEINLNEYDKIQEDDLLKTTKMQDLKIEKDKLFSKILDSPSTSDVITEVVDDFTLNQPEKSEEEEMSDEFVECDDNMNENNIFEKTENTLKNMLTRIECPGNEISRSLSVFMTYMTLQEQPLIEIEAGERRYFNWLWMREQDNWHYLADIALRLQNCPCSEASAERVISCQRLIHSVKRLRSTDKLLNARLKLMRSIVQV